MGTEDYESSLQRGLETELFGAYMSRDIRGVGARGKNYVAEKSVKLAYVHQLIIALSATVRYKRKNY